MANIYGMDLWYCICQIGYILYMFVSRHLLWEIDENEDHDEDHDGDYHRDDDDREWSHQLTVVWEYKVCTIAIRGWRSRLLIFLMLRGELESIWFHLKQCLLSLSQLVFLSRRTQGKMCYKFKHYTGWFFSLVPPLKVPSTKKLI